ncbi:hypothetical protein AAP_01855 [Ascosphaera apis ARSEF 7405]|uniref:Uncharacterized protein n=1 Tax=Ascosphaera apis ARSEF 7405 TaxID=392613 RepID=A0A168AZ25_9EURO|nr:hypothetical protein AAP_01855 [Ascosphaera apis ARSEF 7405]
MSFTRSYRHVSLASGKLLCCQSQLTSIIPASVLLSTAPSSQFSTSTRRNGTPKPTFHRNTRRRERKRQVTAEFDAIEALVRALKQPRPGSADTDAVNETVDEAEGQEARGNDSKKALDDMEADLFKPVFDSGMEHEEQDTYRPSDSLPRSMLELRIPATREMRHHPKKKAMFEKENKHPLAYNVYARALASPIRACHATGVRLPNAFLISFGLVQHPETKALWFMPTNLMKKELKIDAKGNREGESARSTKFIRPAYMSMQPSLYRSLAKLAHKNIGRWLMPTRWKVPFGPVTKTQERSAVWRQDMDMFIFKQLQAQVVDAFLKSHLYMKRPDMDVHMKSNVALDLGLTGGVDELQEALDQLPWVDGTANMVGKPDITDKRNWGAVVIIRNAGIAPKIQEESEGDAVEAASELDSQIEPQQEKSEGDAVEAASDLDSQMELQQEKSEDMSVSSEMRSQQEPSGEAAVPPEPTVQSELQQENMEEPATPSEPYTFPDLIKPSFTQGEIPIFDLSKLLTEEHLETLRTRGHNKRLFNERGAFFIQPVQGATTKVISTLWQLRCYVGGDE